MRFPPPVPKCGCATALIVLQKFFSDDQFSSYDLFVGSSRFFETFYNVFYIFYNEFFYICVVELFALKPEFIASIQSDTHSSVNLEVSRTTGTF